MTTAPDKCQNCGYSSRHSRQKAGEVPQYVDCCSAWMCAACRKLRGCTDPATPPTSEMMSRHAIASRVPVSDGLYPDIDENIYHADPHSLSSSGARKLLSTTPAEFLHERNEPPAPKKQYDLGHLAHWLVLGKGSRIGVLDPKIHGLTADGKQAEKPTATANWKKAENAARSQGKVPIHIDVYRETQAMCGKVFENRIAAKLLSAGNAETSAYHHDDETGVRIRARFDWLPERRSRLIIVDYKTALTADPAKFIKSTVDYGYDCQAAWYIDAAREQGLDDDPGFLFIVQAKSAPYLVSLVQLEPEWIEHGRAKNRRAIDLYSQCTETNTWPGYGEDIHTATMPPWLRRQLDNAA